MAKVTTKNWFFTFGTDPHFPYQDGWIEIEAPDEKTAREVFHAYYPNIRNGEVRDLLNCAFVYSEEEFAKIRSVYKKDMCHARHRVETGIRKERIMDILISYIDNDLGTADPGYVREVVESICSKEEMKELGLYDWLGFDEEE